MNLFWKPRWILFVNTIPISFLFLSFLKDSAILSKFLSPESIVLWKWFLGFLIAYYLVSIFYFLFLTLKKKEISVIYSFASLVFSTGFLYLFYSNSDRLFPFEIPNWMVSETLFLDANRFLMPLAFYSLFTIVIFFSQNLGFGSFLWNFFAAIGIPIGIYFLSQIFSPIWIGTIPDQYRRHVVTILFITISCLFLFFVLRAVLVFLLRYKDTPSMRLVVKVLFSCLFPLLGLALNDGNLGQLPLPKEGVGFFGDFSSRWFYAFAILNGLFVCLPEKKNLQFAQIAFFLQSITLPFTIYFFLVFLPFLPVSIIAVLLFGLGFLMLTPMVLAVIHADALKRNYETLMHSISRKRIVFLFLFGVSLLPLAITGNFWNQKRVLHTAIDYIYSPNYAEEVSVDVDSLAKVLDTLQTRNSRNSDWFSSQTPYITSYYNWILFGGLGLSSQKLNTLQKVFLGSDQILHQYENLSSSGIYLNKHTIESKYDPVARAWKSWFHVELTNPDPSNFQKEFGTNFALPEGSFVQDFYLFVGDKKEPGILSEKKSALWIYNQITSERKDPAVLYFSSGNTLSLRIFPFSKKETRKLGIQFVHREPMELRFLNQTFSFGASKASQEVFSEVEGLPILKTPHTIYVSKLEKQKLPLVFRTPHLHFILDISKSKEEFAKKALEKLETLSKNSPKLFLGAKLSLVDSQVKTILLQKSGEEFLQEARKYIQARKLSGGFYLDRATRKHLVRGYSENRTEVPIFYILTDSLESVVLTTDFSDLEFTFPDKSEFYVDSLGDTITSHSLLQYPWLVVKKIPKSISFQEIMRTDKLFQFQVGNESYFLENSNSPSVIYRSSLATHFQELLNSEYTFGDFLELQAQSIFRLFHPEREETWNLVLRKSFQTKVLVPETTYIVVETEAQKLALERKQEEVISGKSSLDIAEETQRMSEPGEWLLLAILFLFGIAYWRRNFRKVF